MKLSEMATPNSESRRGALMQLKSTSSAPSTLKSYHEVYSESWLSGL
jgi:hypothetical protein